LLQEKEFHYFKVAAVRSVAHSTRVQLSTAVTFRCGLAGSMEATARRRTGDCTSS